jgi:hypothetical protein
MGSKKIIIPKDAVIQDGLTPEHIYPAKDIDSGEYLIPENSIENKIRSLGVTEKLIGIIESEIEKALKQKNNFWWGCLIGVAYNSRVDTVRVEKGEEYETDNNNFKPIVKVKYLSPYDEKIKSRIVKWYKK